MNGHDFFVVLALIALVVTHSQGAMRYASPTGTAPKDCTAETPCSLQDACSAAQDGDTVQVLDGNYQMGDTACVISAPNVSVIGNSKETVGVVCNNECFSLEAIPVTLSSMAISSSGSSNPPPRAAIYGYNATPSPGMFSTLPVTVSDVTIVTTFNDFFYVHVAATNFTDASVMVSIEDTTVAGSAPLAPSKGLITASAANLVVDWNLSSLTITDVTTNGDRGVIEVPKSDLSHNVVIDGLAVTNSTIYYVIDALGGGTFSLDNATIDSVSNYFYGYGAQFLVGIDRWDYVTIANVTFSNIIDDVGGLLYFGGKFADVRDITVMDCHGHGDGIVAGCKQDPCFQTVTNLSGTNFYYSIFAGFSYDYYSNTTVTVDTASFTDGSGSPILGFDRCGAIEVSDATFTGGVYDRGAIWVGDIKSFNSTGIVVDGVQSSQALITFEALYEKKANITFDGVHVKDSLIAQTVFLFTPADAIWEIVISNSDFETTGTNTTAIVSCYDGGDDPTGGAEVLVETSTCELADGCSIIDQGYISDDVCTFKVDNEALCDAPCYASSGGENYSSDGEKYSSDGEKYSSDGEKYSSGGETYSSGGGSYSPGDSDDAGADWGEIILWTCVGLLVLVGIVVVIALVVVAGVIVARKRKSVGYESI